MRGRRTDRNHSEIRDGLRSEGWDVLDLSGVGGGVPDLCVRDHEGRMPLFMEVKDGDKPPSARELTKAEVQWQRFCGAITVTVLSLDEAREACKKQLGKVPSDNKK